jgi:hypothetical protein
MINTGPATDETDTSHDAEVSSIMQSGATGAVVLAGIATAIVLAIWFAFYLLVFVPRAGAP